MTGFLAAVVLASSPVRRVLGRLRPGCAARADREWRDVHGMARHHPESLTRALRRREERRLAALRAELWPHDEYEAEL
jgi:hypothetical protein